MARVYRASVLVPAPIERTWQLWTDAARYPQWQTALQAVRDLSGRIDQVGTTYVLHHGPRLDRTVRVLAVDRPVRHVIEQSGMGIRDETSVTFEPEPGGTRLTLVVYAHMHPAMELLSRLERRSQQELQRELDRFASLATRVPPPARAGSVYVAAAGGIRRRLTVLAADLDRVHVRLHPGRLAGRDPDDVRLAAPKPPSQQLELSPLAPPLRASFDAMATGLPFLRRDGGHGVAHLALSLDAWADAAPRETGREALRYEDGEAVEAWRARRAPTVGVDGDLDLAPLCTLRLSEGDRPWAVAKVLRGEVARVHLSLYADRWRERPEGIRSWALTTRELDEKDLDAGRFEPASIGHLPVTRAAFQAARPRFAGVTTLEHDELEGYRTWGEARGGTFVGL